MVDIPTTAPVQLTPTQGGAPDAEQAQLDITTPSFSSNFGSIIEVLISKQLITK
jgi:hypothetical protein